MIRFRHYEASDRRACLAIFDSNCPGFLHAQERPDFEAWLDAPGGTYLVLEEEREVIGSGGYTVVARSGLLTLTWGLLHADRHGRGLGQLLLLERLVRGIEDGGAKVSSVATSPQVEPFFARVGYRRVGRSADGWGPGLDRVDMRLDIDPRVAAELRRRHGAARERCGARLAGQDS